MSNGAVPEIAAKLAETTRSLQEAISEAQQYKALYEDAAMQSTALRRRVQELEERLARLGGGDAVSSMMDGGSFGGPFALGGQGVEGEGSSGADVSLGLADPRRQVDHEHEQIRQMREMLQQQRQQQQQQKPEEDVKALPAHIFSEEDRAALSSQIAALDGDEEAGVNATTSGVPSDSVDASWSGANLPGTDALEGLEGDAMARYTAPATSQMDDDGAVNFDDYTDFSHDAPS